MSDESILATWHYYEGCDIPGDADPARRAECRRAFYAGAYAMLLMYERIIHLDVPLHECIAIVDGLKREWVRFVGSVATGEDVHPRGY